jgi:hypothetical protein
MLSQQNRFQFNINFAWLANIKKRLFGLRRKFVLPVRKLLFFFSFFGVLNCFWSIPKWLIESKYRHWASKLLFVWDRTFYLASGKKMFWKIWKSNSIKNNNNKKTVNVLGKFLIFITCFLFGKFLYLLGKFFINFSKTLLVKRAMYGKSFIASKFYFYSNPSSV